jgi:hypothetical protein
MIRAHVGGLAKEALRAEMLRMASIRSIGELDSQFVEIRTKVCFCIGVSGSTRVMSLSPFADPALSICRTFVMAFEGHWNGSKTSKRNGLAMTNHTDRLPEIAKAETVIGTYPDLRG